MAGITQKSCATLFPLWSLKKTFDKSFDKKSCQYDDKCNNNCYFSDNKDKKFKKIKNVMGNLGRNRLRDN